MARLHSVAQLWLNFAIRKSGRGGYWDSNCDGLRSFVGSRAADVDYTVEDEPSDCSWNGAPNWGLAVDMHNKAVGEAYQHWNTSGIADGLLTCAGCHAHPDSDDDPALICDSCNSSSLRELQKISSGEPRLRCAAD